MYSPCTAPSQSIQSLPLPGIPDTSCRGYRVLGVPISKHCHRIQLYTFILHAKLSLSQICMLLSLYSSLVSLAHCRYSLPNTFNAYEACEKSDQSGAKCAPICRSAAVIVPEDWVVCWPGISWVMPGWEQTKGQPITALPGSVVCIF